MSETPARVLPAARLANVASHARSILARQTKGDNRKFAARFRGNCRVQARRFRYSYLFMRFYLVARTSLGSYD